MDEDQSQPQSDQPQGAKSAHPLDQRIVQVARVVMATKQQVEQLNGAVAELTSQQQHIDAVASDLKSRLGEFRERLDSTSGIGEGNGSIGGDAHDLGPQLEKLEQDLGQVLAGMDSTAARVELASSKIDEQVYALKGRVTGFADGVEQWFKPARSEIDANRAFVDQASEQIRQKLLGFEKAAQDLQSCVESGVADLQRRHESRDVNLSALSVKLDDCLGRLDHHADKMGERASEHFRPLIDGLTTHISTSCVGQKQLADYLRTVQMEIEAAIARSEQRVTPALSDFSARLGTSETVTDEIRETCRALQNQVGGAVGRLEERIADIQRSVDTSLSAKLDDKIARFQEHVSEILSAAAEGRREADERVTGQLAGIQEGLEAWSRRSEEDAVHRTELSWEQKELGAALGRLEEKIEATLESHSGQSTENQEHAAGVARQLGELRAQLSESVDPVVTALRNRERESDATAAVVSLGFKDVQQQLNAISGQLDDRVARSLSEMHAQSQQVHEAAVTQHKDLTSGQKELGMAMLRLQSRVSDSLANLTDQQTRQSDQAGSLTGELADLRENLTTLADQLATLGDQFGVMTAEIDNRMTAALADADRAARIEFTSVRNEFSDLSTKIKALMSTPRSNDEPGGSYDDALVVQELADLKTRLEAVPCQVQDKVAEAVAEIGRTSSREQEQLTAVERQLDDLREQLSTLGDRFDGIIGEMDKRVAVGAGGDPSGMPDSANVERMLDDLRASIAEVGLQIGDKLEPLAAVPGQVENKVADAISRLTRTPSREQEQLTGVERQLDDLREHIATLSDRMAGMISSEIADGSGGVPPESAGRIAATVERGMATLRDRLEAVAGQVDTRVSEMLAAQPQRESVTPALLSDVVQRLEQQVTTAIGEVAVREADADLSRQLETQLDGLQEQLASLGRRFGALESSLTEADTPPRVRGTDSDRDSDRESDYGVERSLEGLQTRFQEARKQLETSVPDSVEVVHTLDEEDGFVDGSAHADVDELDELAPPMDAVSPEDTGFIDDDGTGEETMSFEIEEVSEDTASYEDTATFEDTDSYQDTARSHDEVTIEDPEPYEDTVSSPDDDLDTEPAYDEPSDHEPAPIAGVPTEPEVPPLPIEELVHTMVGVINSGNNKLMQKFIAEQYASSALAERDAEARVEVFMGVHEETGEMRVVNWEVGDEGEIVVVLQTRLSLDRMRFEIIRDNAAAHKITQINIDRI